jgi:hypothetical protein
MRYLMKYLQQVGLVSTLLTGGILGGLLAPLPSESAAPTAPPTVTLKMDAGEKVTFPTLTLMTCLAGDISPGGYNYCYTVPTGGIVTGTGGRQYRVAPNGTPRVRIADKNGQDKMSLTGVQFVPVGSWPDDESHTLTLTLSAKLDATTDGATGPPINVTNAGLYKWAVRSSGEFLGSSGSDPVGNTLVLTGVGTFSPTNKNKNILSTSNPAARRGTKNLTTLSFNIQGPADTADINWGGTSNTDMGQVDPYYPEFDCRGGTATTYPENTVAAACRPTITQTLTATIIGMDTLKVLAGPLDVLGVKCTETISAQQTKQIKFLNAVVKVLTFFVPHIQDDALQTKIQNLLNELNTLLTLVNTPPDLACPGARVLAFNIAVEAAPDLLYIATASSKPGITAPLHYYAVISRPAGVTWEHAGLEIAALSRSDCHLATITSATEQAIINGILPDPSGFPVGHAQDYWIGGKQQSGAGESGGNWEWINYEGIFWNSSQPNGQNGAIAGMFANWGTNPPGPGVEPNNAGGNENHLTVDNRYGWGWNDLNTNGPLGKTEGYITEATAGPCEPLPLPPVIIN